MKVYALLSLWTEYPKYFGGKLYIYLFFFFKKFIYLLLLIIIIIIIIIFITSKNYLEN